MSTNPLKYWILAPSSALKGGQYAMLLGLLFALGCQQSNAQSPWTRSKAGFYAQAAYYFLPEYTAVFKEGTTERPLDRALSEGTLELYGEYGLNAQTTLVTSVPFRFLKSGDFLNHTLLPETNAGQLSAFGNVHLGVRHRILSEPLTLSTSLYLDLPTASYRTNTGLRSGYSATTLQPMVSIGKSNYRTYAFAYGSYGLRTGGYSDFIDTGIEAGLTLGPIWVIAFSQWLHPLGNGNIIFPIANNFTSLYVDNQGWLSVGFKGIWQINRFIGLHFSAAGAAQAQNVPMSPNLGAGLYFKWD